MVEHAAVNRGVEGSSPSSGAILADTQHFTLPVSERLMRTGVFNLHIVVSDANLAHKRAGKRFALHGAQRLRHGLRSGCQPGLTRSPVVTRCSILSCTLSVFMYVVPGSLDCTLHVQQAGGTSLNRSVFKVVSASAKSIPICLYNSGHYVVRGRLRVESPEAGPPNRPGKPKSRPANAKGVVKITTRSGLFGEPGLV